MNTGESVSEAMLEQYALGNLGVKIKESALCAQPSLPQNYVVLTMHVHHIAVSLTGVAL